MSSHPNATPLQLLLAHWKMFFLVFTLVFGVGVLVVELLPQTYRSKAEVVVPLNPVPDSLMNTSFQGFTDENASRLFAIYKTPESIKTILTRFPAIADVIDEKDPGALDRLVEKIRAKLALEFRYDFVDMPKYYELVRIATAFYITADSENPALAAFVANNVARGIVADNDKQHLESAQKFVAFLSRQREKLSSELQGIQNRILTLEGTSYDELPLDEREKRSSLAKLNGELEGIKVRIAVGESIIAKLDAQLSKFGGQANQASSDASLGFLVSRLDEAETELNTMKTVYSGDYPDIQQGLRTLEDLKARLEQVESGSSSWSTAGLDYLSAIKLQREDYANRVQRYRIQAAGVEGQITGYENRLKGGSDVEQAYRKLLVEEMGIKEQFKQLRQMEFGARMVLNLNESHLAGGFYLKRNGQISDAPLYPNLLANLVLVAYVALLAAIMVTLRRVKNDFEIRNRGDLNLAVGDAVLAVIPQISSGRPSKSHTD